jgi:hypothetical protein
MDEKTIVLTMYGKGEKIESISVSLFDQQGNWQRKNEAALNFCFNINALELAGDEWIYARIVHENEKIPLKKLSALDLLLKLPANYLKSYLNAPVINANLAYILKKADENTKNRLLSCMSQNNANSLRDDLVHIPVMDKRAIDAAEQKMIAYFYQHYSNYL